MASGGGWSDVGDGSSTDGGSGWRRGATATMKRRVVVRIQRAMAVHGSSQIEGGSSGSAVEWCMRLMWEKMLEQGRGKGRKRVAEVATKAAVGEDDSSMGCWRRLGEAAESR
ncbi:hypothetical protein BHM03_00027189 [Ensete ventricosum]|nr:hypothetical protein BHM03_00027189 [Ensete ventricosum]